MATPTYELIESFTVTSNTTSVIFDNITQDYTDLVFIFNLTASSTYKIEANFNDDFSSSYEAQNMIGNGSSANSVPVSSQAFALAGTANGLSIFQIMSYSKNNKDTVCLLRDNVSTSSVTFGGQRYDNVSAVNKIEIRLDGNNTILAGSTINFYGVL